MPRHSIQTLRYTIDCDDRIVSWTGSGIANDGRFPLLPESSLGESIWRFIPGAAPRRLLSTLYERVRAEQKPLFLPLRGDTPQRRRLLDLQLRPLDERAIAHVCDCVWAEARSVPVLFEPTGARGDLNLSHCAFCHRIKVARNDWREVEDACLLLRLDRGERSPVLDPTVCFGCQQTLLNSVAGLAT